MNRSDLFLVQPWDREYFYEIDLSGRLLHDGTVLTEEKFLRFFMKQLRANDTGMHSEYPFISPCGREMNFVHCSDTPIVYSALVGDKLTAHGGITSSFDPASLRFGENSALYHPAPVGDYGRIRADLLLEFGRRIEPWGPYYAWRDGHRFTVIEPIQGPEKIQLLRPRSDHMCFGCSAENPSGFALSFLFHSDDLRVESWWTAPPSLQGAPGILHGGFTSLLLDETMAKTLTGQNLKGYTAHLEVNFRKPCPVNHPLALTAKFESRSGRKFEVSGTVRSAADGEIFSEGTALFVERKDSE